MKVPRVIFSACRKDTDSLVFKFSKLISPNSIIYLNGDVGAGKTYFTQRLANQFGIFDLSSSSYERISIYKERINFIHCDLYRDDNSNMLLCELDYHLIDPWILVIEWPKQYFPISKCEQFLVNISFLKKNERLILIECLTNSKITI